MISDEPKKNNTRNFTYLQDLILRGDSEIILESDIFLSNNEEEIFEKGIEINGDVIIDGHNHIIDACNKTRILNTNSRKVTLKNIVFKNAFGSYDGGAIKHDSGKLEILDCKFIDSSCEKNGSAIHVAPRCRLKVSGCEFLSNHANDGCIYNFNGTVEITDSRFAENASSSIINQKRGRILIKDTHFLNNVSEKAGPIVNRGKCDMSGCLFENNATMADGGAINNQLKGLLNISDTKFIENECRGDGGAIVNFSRVTLDNVKFLANVSNDLAGAISNQKTGSVAISNSKFIGNSAEMNGGAIINWGSLDIGDCKFKDNSSQILGGAIFNQESSVLKVKSTPFINNRSDSGGAIFNWGRIYLNDVSFENNSSQMGGAINTAKNAVCNLYKSDFTGNSSKKGGAIFNNCENTKMVDCKFSKHSTSNVVYNFRLLYSFNNVFEANNCENVIFNDDEAIIWFSAGEFNDNKVNVAVVNNQGDDCSLDNVIFNNNSSMRQFCSDIYNGSRLRLTNSQFKSNKKTVLNEGSIDVKRMNMGMIIKAIHDCGIINDLSKRDNEYDFTHLEDLMGEKTDLKLDHDYSIGDYELDFYGGGIEIAKDNTVIDGCGHTIDGHDASRIFIINACGVVLRNIVFKNGFFSNGHDRYCLGGGAILVLGDASVSIEDCRFIENRSLNNGGAIFSDGNVNSSNNKFINNESKNFGGAIENRNSLTTNSDEFKGNVARIGAAIYNKGDLCIEKGIEFSDNSSQFRQAIYNAGFMQSVDFTPSDNLIFNTSKIHGFSKFAMSFMDLASEMEKSDMIVLDEDIRFDFERDFYLKYRIDIKKDLTIDGCGHVIEYNPLNFDDLRFFDCMKSASLFRIRKNDIRVILRNIVFKDCYANGKDIIENHGELILENCRFTNNHVTSDKSLINNKNSLKVINTSFSNNISNMQSLIANDSHLEMSNVDFINNNSHAMGCCISNAMEAEIMDSTFKSNNTSDKAGCINNEFKSKLRLINVKFNDNDADVDGGVIYNYGEIEIEDSKFANNFSMDEGGAINSRTSGRITVSNSEFIRNESKNIGGAIFNYGKVDIVDCRFIANNARVRAGAIEHTRPLDNRDMTHLKVSGTEFSKNTARDNKSICSYDGADVDISGCKFDEG